MSKYWPADTSVPSSNAHGQFTAWIAAKAPDLDCGHNLYTQGRLRSCDHCGSMHPADLAAAIRAGVTVEWADFKYGWPHKAYAEGVPNPFAGMRNSTVSTGYGSKKGERDAHAKAHMERNGGEWVQLANPADLEKMKPEHVGHSWHMVEQERATRHGKFYTVHLKDATPEDRETIEKALGLRFEFLEPDGVRWQPWFEKVS